MAAMSGQYPGTIKEDQIGSTVVAGQAGANGANGNDGAAGAKGPDGPQGNTGIPGAAPRIFTRLGLPEFKVKKSGSSLNVTGSVDFVDIFGWSLPQDTCGGTATATLGSKSVKTSGNKRVVVQRADRQLLRLEHGEQLVGELRDALPHRYNRERDDVGLTGLG